MSNQIVYVQICLILQKKYLKFHKCLPIYGKLFDLQLFTTETV